MFSLSARKQNPSMKYKINAATGAVGNSTWMARPPVGCETMQRGWTRAPSALPPCSVVGLWRYHDRLCQNGTLREGFKKKKRNKKNIPAYTKVNKLIVKKISLGSRHCFTRALVVPGCPVQSREGASLRGRKDGPRVPAGPRHWCALVCTGAVPSLLLGSRRGAAATPATAGMVSRAGVGPWFSAYLSAWKVDRKTLCKS